MAKVKLRFRNIPSECLNSKDEKKAFCIVFTDSCPGSSEVKQ